MTTLLAIRNRSAISKKLTSATELSSTSRFHCNIWPGKISSVEDSIRTLWLSRGRSSNRGGSHVTGVGNWYSVTWLMFKRRMGKGLFVDPEIGSGQAAMASRRALT